MAKVRERDRQATTRKQGNKRVVKYTLGQRPESEQAEGARAFKLGLSKSANPYLGGGVGRNSAWIKGYNRARMAAQKDNANA